MEVKFTFTEDDYFKSYMYLNENLPMQKKAYKTYRYITPFLFYILICVISASLNIQLKYPWGFVFVFFGLLWIIMYPKIYIIIFRRSVRKRLQDCANPNIHYNEQTFLIEEDSMTFNNECSSLTLSKKNIKDIKIYDDMLMIYLHGNTAHGIPTRYLDEENKKYIIKIFNMLQIQ